MLFEWDGQRNASNLRKHGLSFEEARHIFTGPVLTRFDNRQDYGERREIRIGRLSQESRWWLSTPSGTG